MAAQARAFSSAVFTCLLVLGSAGEAHAHPAAVGYSLAQPGRVRLEVFNVLGQSMVTLVQAHQLPGRYAVTWDADAAPDGVYVYRLQVAGRVVVKKMVLMR